METSFDSNNVLLVLGELYPKRVALQNAEGIAKFEVIPILSIWYYRYRSNK